MQIFSDPKVVFFIHIDSIWLSLISSFKIFHCMRIDFCQICSGSLKNILSSDNIVLLKRNTNTGQSAMGSGVMNMIKSW